MNERKTRILIADDHALMRIGLTSLIACEKDMSVVGEAENGEDAVRLAEKLKPDVAVLDLMMPVVSGAEAVRRIRLAHPETHTVILTSYGTAAEMTAAIRNGADAALLKDLPADEFIAALRAVAHGKKVIPPEFLHAAEELSLPLTERQLAILTAMTKGYSNPDIARTFGITVAGVKKQVKSIFVKLGASNRQEVIAIALNRQMVHPWTAQ